MSVRDLLTRRLEEALSPASLSVIDESDQHRGHGGWREGGQTHFRIEVVAEAFRGKSRVERHRMVNALAADAFAAGLHALALSAKAPGE